MHSAQSLYDVHGINAGQRASSRHRTLRSLLSLLTKLAWATKSKMQVQRDIAELASLDDRMLRDIGVNRSEIESVVRRSTRLTSRR